MNEFEATAEHIIRLQGFIFSLASKVGKESDLREARELLKQAIVKALADVAAAAKEGHG